MEWLTRLIDRLLSIFPRLVLIAPDEADVLKGVREASEGWGLRVDKVYITDIGRTQNIRILLNESIFKEIE